jgi:hypothetical protein
LFALVWALARMKSKKFFVVLVYLFTVLWESAELPEAVRKFIECTPATMQYKEKKPFTG